MTPIYNHNSVIILVDSVGIRLHFFKTSKKSVYFIQYGNKRFRHFGK